MNPKAALVGVHTAVLLFGFAGLFGRWLDMSVARQAKCKIADEIDKQFPTSRLFVTKDPRVSRLLPLWLEVFDELAVTPIIVIPFRNPLDVALSLKKRNQLTLAKSMLMYARSYLEIERTSRDR